MIYAMRQRTRADNLTVIVQNNDFRHNMVKVVCGCYEEIHDQ